MEGNMAMNKLETNAANEMAEQLNATVMEKTAGGIPKVGAEQANVTDFDCPAGGPHAYVYTGKEKPGDIFSFWPDKEKVCKKCGNRIWADW